ncbi:helix-turn-helix domain-containing protein [Promicromonospora sp. Populi]|uniref:helix-turn-helix domain-containing protein n=1 Tax=Promicromonospora sp. Populi TaxID=3239420 RepID=UPI0034E29325
MDKVALGRRLTQARELAGMTQDSLARAVGLDRTAVTRLEKGERKLSVPELVEIAEAVGRPLSYFVAPVVPAVVSRRSDATTHDSTQTLDVELEQFADDLRMLMDMGLLHPAQRAADARTPRTHPEAERMAERVRRQLDLGTQPISNLGDVCEKLGLYTYGASLGRSGADGGCVEVVATSPITRADIPAAGAAVVNGDAPTGRRRMTLAHELGHWLTGDAYDAQSSGDNERMINSFAIHFVAPRAGVADVWRQYDYWSTRDRALAVGAEYRLSWSATVGQLSNLNLIERGEFDALSQDEPRAGDYLRLGLSWPDDLAGPYLSPGFAAACINAYASGQLTADRALELLRGTLTEAGLPRQDRSGLEDLRRSFTGHDD